MKKVYITTIITTLSMILIFCLGYYIIGNDKFADRHINVGFVYDGDESTPYTESFIRAQRKIEKEFGEQVTCFVKSNVTDEDGEEAIRQLIDEKCDIIFTCSYGYSFAAKDFAAEHPDIQFCAATGDNAGDDPILANYHNFMGRIYEGRYISGVIAGMKMQQLIDDGEITGDQKKIGYVAAFPYAEVISGYTAFFLGVRSVVPDVVMSVKYANTWSDYGTEKMLAEELIDEGCVIISQHSDTIGPAVACENVSGQKPVIHIGYNQSMIDVAPTTSLLSTRIDWAPYMTQAVGAVLEKKKIEDVVVGQKYKNDVGAGFEEGWVQVVDLNQHLAPPDAAKVMKGLINDFKSGRIDVFKGDYTGTDPYDPENKIDLRDGYVENSTSSAPRFSYVLDDVITIEE